jgi:hypothetical protein
MEKIGFRTDIGYHTFLYPNEADTRNVVTFLLERLPKTDDSKKGGVSLFN